MSRSETFINNFICSALLQVFLITFGFVVPKIILTVYGSEIFGLVSSIIQFIGYFNLVEAGLTNVTVYALYKPLAEKNIYKINSILSAAKKIYSTSGKFFLVLLVSFSFFYSFLINCKSVSVIEISVLIYLLGFSGIADFFVISKYKIMLTADQKLYVLSLIRICEITLNIAITAFLAFHHINIVFVTSAALFAVFFRSVAIWFYFKRKYPFVNYNIKPDSSSLKNRWDAFYLQILGTIHIGSPIVIATLFTNLKMVSVYSIFNLVFMGISGLISIATSGLYTSFGEIIAQNRQKVLQQAYQEFELIFYMLITWIYSCSYILIMPFIRLYTKGVTDINYNLPLIGTLFVINGLIFNIKVPQGMLVISAGLFRETRFQTLTQGLLAVFSGIILVQFFGIEGIVAGSIISNIYRDIDLIIFIPKNVTQIKIRNTLYRLVLEFVCFGVVVVPFQYLNFSVNNYVEWAKMATIVSFYSFSVVFLLNLIFERTIFLSLTTRLNSVLSNFWRIR